MIKRALISVSDKEGIVEFTTRLQSKNIEILSTGGTAKALKEAGIDVTDVSDYTGFPEMMDGRVKTLHPKVHGGLLAVRDNEGHMAEAQKNDIGMIDLVVVNLYPFKATAQTKGKTEEEVIEQIDIGGPSMLRSAAKNFKSVTVVMDTADYAKVIEQIEEAGDTTPEFRKELAEKVFAKTCEYDMDITYYFNRAMKGNGDSPEMLDLHYEKVMSLRYGENPHQNAAFFRNPNNKDANITNAKILSGKELSYNNIVDADFAIEMVKEFENPAAIFVKHNNPCGSATADTLIEAFEKGHQVDPMSAFGCVIAINRECTKEIVEYTQREKMFIEIIAAPSFTSEALEMLKEKKNLRVLELSGKFGIDYKRRDIKKVAGGILVQNADTKPVLKEELKVVTKKAPTDEELETLLFARILAKHAKSNAVVYAKKEGSCYVATGMGVGQMSRVDSAIIAGRKGGDRVKGSVMASDAFFPFSDAVEAAAEAGVTAIIQPGGSIRDDEVIARCDELGLSMVFSGVRNFRH
ncbi:MAG: bifunctional phosphoribosylaminoimidazolecarboxamide formyltransferase/IMP cyclohydrolase [Candidatus Peregrinibacteria bacterium]|nr:bifunctional phosphoribosylaminoimidazolecarboxamide formyltransferase/IMP cyclohydrolase [Candidatus Peregrinibacteria bacterium]MDZ4244348.1 bifunctional phosphoribosylaminoimidazolecarboxamide formyltransferase/IMP cyclohydrolase [Candidatus Gracilibacteria bacterium]